MELYYENLKNYIFDYESAYKNDLFFIRQKTIFFESRPDIQGFVMISSVLPLKKS